MKKPDYAIHYVETNTFTNEDVVDKIIGANSYLVLQAIRIFVKEHPIYDWEDATRIMKEVSPSIEDAFVSHSDGKDYWLIIHKLEKETAENK